MKYSDLYIGQSASISRRFTTEDVKTFSDMCLDKNPVHLDEEYAKKHNIREGVGLAAPQIGENIRAIAVTLRKEEKK